MFGKHGQFSPKLTVHGGLQVAGRHLRRELGQGTKRPKNQPVVDKREQCPRA